MQVAWFPQAKLEVILSCGHIITFDASKGECAHLFSYLCPTKQQIKNIPIKSLWSRQWPEEKAHLVLPPSRCPLWRSEDGNRKCWQGAPRSLNVPRTTEITGSSPRSMGLNVHVTGGRAASGPGRSATPGECKGKGLWRKVELFPSQETGNPAT